MTGVGRRDILAAGAGAAALLAGSSVSGAAEGRSGGPLHPGEAIDARSFGIAGDGKTDDTGALQRAFDAAFAGPEPRVLLIPPGVYKTSRTLSLETRAGAEGNKTHRCGILAQGARIESAITDGSPVVRVTSHATVRFLLIEGLEIAGSGRDGHGLDVQCQQRGTYLYNFCLRDIVVQGCGGDGCRMIGNIFEGQLINCYFRDNHGNGASFSHGPENTVLSALHVFGGVFGGNRENGAVLTNGAADVSFHGCYFLLNGKFGVSADHGCTLLSNCGFENNHQAAPGFQQGDAGIRLMVFGTLVGCTAYSIHHQKQLIRAFITNELVMIGCTGSGGGDAKSAGLGRLEGRGDAHITLIGCRGAVDQQPGPQFSLIGMPRAAAPLGGIGDGGNLAQLGDYYLWVDRSGHLRIKRGMPNSDTDGKPVGA